ncbi:MAG: PAS domain S-box protein [Nitrospinae bacterium]|nr:PAS domain S-box protein [Nitrospinota bacterium]
MNLSTVKKRLGESLWVLIITIMAVMVGLTSLFIYSNVTLQNKVTYKTVQQTDFIADLLASLTIDVLGSKHDAAQYGQVLKYGDMIGINEIGVYTNKGEEAFLNQPSEQKGAAERGPGKGRRIQAAEMGNFKKAVLTMNKTDFFDHKNMTYSGFIPLKNEGACAGCHMKKGEVLGILAVKLSTKDDFEILKSVQTRIWGLGFIVLIPIVGMVVTLFIFREKSRLYSELAKSNESIKNTFDSLKETQNYLQLILDNSKALIITTNEEGNIVEFNKEAREILGYLKEEVVGKSARNLYQNPEQREELLKEKASEKDPWAVRSREVQLKAKSGRIVPVFISISALVNDYGKIIGTVGVGKDVSEQKMLQSQLLQSEKMAGIGVLASGIAHEINNPLAGILGMAEAIRDEPDPALMKSYSEDIIKYALDAGNIVKELSSYSRHARDESRSTVDLAAIMEYSLKMAMHSVPFVDIQVVTRLAENTSIFANEGEMQQVFVNLMVNAIHAMKDKGTLTLECRHDGDYILASVSDTGHGIPETDIKRIFDPFFTTKPAGKGTGLGLYVVYKIVTKYGGDVDIYSKVEEGTTFTLKFPVGTPVIGKDGSNEEKKAL